MYISRIVLDDVRCFPKGFTLDLKRKGKPVLWTTLLGENATGKTTLLRSIAIGLCDESSAAGLLKESETGYIRRGANDATIEITLCDKGGKKKGTIKTIIYKVKGKGYSFERLMHKVGPKSFQPWGDIFVCAYGMGRGSAGTGDVGGYTAISAVYNLFNYSEGLQNPELVLRRLKTKAKRDQAKHLLRELLNLKKTDKISLMPDGILIDGPWGRKMPLRDLADGYRATFLWMADFLGWAISDSAKVAKIKEIKGIVLIDAIEEHLHPTWQRLVVKKLTDLLPNIQFITATHSPLIASGAADVVSSEIVGLKLEDEKGVSSYIIPSDSLKGMRADQVLRSNAFGLTSTISPDSVSAITRYSELKGKKSLSPDEKKEARSLKKQLVRGSTFGNTNFEEEVERAVMYTLERMLRRKPEEIHRLVAKRKLREIFGTKKEK